MPLINRFFDEDFYKMKCFSPDFQSLFITVNKVFAEMEYGKRQPEEQFVMLTETLLEEIQDIATPKFAYKVYRGRVDGENVYLNETVRLQVGTVLSSLMKGSEYVAVFTATAGDSFQRYQNELKKEDDLLKTYIADAIGSCIAESAGDYMERMLEKEIKGLRHTNRFSPGYCGWHLSGQKEIFRILGGNPCDITLSDSCLMMPIKSISGIIGIGYDVNERIYGCQYCELKSCYKRKT